MRQSLRFQTIAQLGVAILLAALAAAVYRTFVFSQFVPIRMDVVGEELHSSNHAVRVPLPNLSILGDQRAVLELRLRNTRSEPRRIGLLRVGFPNTRVVLPPNRTIRWDIVLSPDAVRALAAEVGDATRSLELTGDADGWALTSLEIRNYHVRLGGRVLAVTLPRQADTYTSATGFLPVGIALLLFVLLAQVVPKTQKRAVHLLGTGLALAAFLVCLTCVILPLISPYKVLLSQPAFWLVAAGLFSPALLGAAGQLPVFSRLILRKSVAIFVAMAGTVSRVLANVTRHWARHEVTYERGAALLGLVAIALAQPIFDVVSNSPEFFAARSTAPLTAVAGPCHLSRNSVFAARDRACDPSGQPARGIDVSRRRAGAPVGSRRDAVVSPRRDAQLPLGRPDQAPLLG